MKKIFRTVHLWLSIPFGIIVTIICFTGALLVFEDEITDSVQHDMLYVDKIEVKKLPMSELVATVSSMLDKDVKITGVTVSSNPERAYKVNLSKPKNGAIYIDQYTGAIKGTGKRLSFFFTIFKLHRWLLDSVKQDGSLSVGKTIVGISTLVFVVIMISGIIIWIPKRVKALKNKLKIQCGKGWRSFNYGLHTAGGVYAGAVLLAMALTGLTWSFEWYNVAFNKVFGVEINANAPKRQNEGIVDKKVGGEKNLPYRLGDKVVAELVSLNPDCYDITVAPNSVNVRNSIYGNQRATDTYTYNPKSGDITKVEYYKDKPKSSKIRGWILSVHTGAWGGIATKILAVLAALLGASLPLTGYYMWYKRLLSRHILKRV